MFDHGWFVFTVAATNVVLPRQSSEPTLRQPQYPSATVEAFILAEAAPTKRNHVGAPSANTLDGDFPQKIAGQAPVRVNSAQVLSGA
jgi:hypothetical protein